MKESLCAHCINCEEVKYDGFLCDCTGYIEDKSVEDGCGNFKDDGFDRAKKALDQPIEDEAKTMYQKESYEDYDKLVKFRNDVIDAIGISNAGYTDDWLDEFVDSQAVDIIRKAVNESARKTSKHYMADLIATMTINGAMKEELDRAIKYSASVIDAERANKELGIDELEKKYMSRYPLPTRVELTCIDPATGEEMVYTGRPLEPGMQFVADRMNEIGKEIVNKHKEENKNER